MPTTRSWPTRRTDSRRISARFNAWSVEFRIRRDCDGFDVLWCNNLKTREVNTSTSLNWGELFIARPFCCYFRSSDPWCDDRDDFPCQILIPRMDDLLWLTPVPIFKHFLIFLSVLPLLISHSLYRDGKLRGEIDIWRIFFPSFWCINCPKFRMP